MNKALGEPKDSQVVWDILKISMNVAKISINNATIGSNIEKIAINTDMTFSNAANIAKLNSSCTEISSKGKLSQLKFLKEVVSSKIDRIFFECIAHTFFSPGKLIKKVRLVYYQISSC